MNPSVLSWHLMHDVKLGILAAFVIVVGSSSAATLGSSGSETPAALASLVQHGYEIKRSFPAAGGLTGWVVNGNGREHIVYSLQDGRHLMVGTLLDEQGHNLNTDYEDRFVSHPDPTALYDKLQHARFIADGPDKSKSVIYVFLDPNCVYCHAAWVALRPYVAAGLQVRWVPVGFLKPSSLGRAAALLESAAPADALRLNEERFNVATEDGGLPPLIAPPSETVKVLRENSDLMAAFGGTGTPTIVWKDTDGKIRIESGMPPLEKLSLITGLVASDLKTRTK
ncbi:thiol:disulfide interchange protein DsbG [Caballeronia udeis]|uniref:Thiol:disulfide interchange protein n=1 Tax=Caballeronia udeis TaxID=1232866 RepID=A0ABW8MQS9_9BURK